jgi:hypothetical protein
VMCTPYDGSRYGSQQSPPGSLQRQNNLYNPPQGYNRYSPSPDKSQIAKEAATDLARLMEQQLGYAVGHIDPIALRLFIRAYWPKVLAYAHKSLYYSPPDKNEVTRDAAPLLARLMERHLGYDVGHIDPVALRLFIRAYWSRVSAYAHSIHDE